MDDAVTEADRAPRLVRILARRPSRNKRVGAPAPAAVGVLVVCLLLVFGLTARSAPLSAQSPPPDEAWRSLDTPNFRITFPASLESLGRRTALIAEDALARLVEAFMASADGRIELVLTDHVDASNGFASVAPLRRVVIYARPPIDGQALSYYDDWLDLVSMA